ncbi:MAG: hypothetical protein HC833_05775 [Leptolyngbyaceae cyanobacterium RM1_406_9]|nr:hypothetical protein [Leptolyngbyaceae cyanobacterium RM1_406_9]
MAIVALMLLVCCCNELLEETARINSQSIFKIETGCEISGDRFILITRAKPFPQLV